MLSGIQMKKKSKKCLKKKKYKQKLCPMWSCENKLKSWLKVLAMGRSKPLCSFCKCKTSMSKKE